MTDKEKEIIRAMNHPLYTVEFLEEWNERNENVFVNGQRHYRLWEQRDFMRP